MCIRDRANAVDVPVYVLHRMRRDQHMLPDPPVRGIDDQIAHAPIITFDEEILDMSDVPVGRVHVVAGDFGNAAEVGIAILRVHLAMFGLPHLSLIHI